MTFLISISFLYIFDFYFIIKADNVNVYNINVDCGDSSFYYNSLIYNCTKCDSSVINENICYSKENKKSIYFSSDGSFDCETQDCNCPSKKFTELDDEGRYYGKLMCLETTISVTENDTNFYNDQNNSYIRNGNDDFILYFLNNPNRTISETPQHTLINPDFYDDDVEREELKYYFHSCIKGYYKKSCQFLANLCTLAIYDEDNRACRIIDKLSDNIRKEIADRQ